MFRLPEIELSMPVGMVLFLVMMIAGAWVGDVLIEGHANQQLVNATIEAGQGIRFLD